MKMKSEKWAWIAAILIIILFPYMVGQSDYFLTLFITACTFIISANALNLLIGYGGQMSVGHAGFLTVGAYVVAIISSTFQFIPFFIILLLAGLITAAVGFLIGLPAVRLRGHFLAVATLGFGISIPKIALYWESLTGGYTGLLVSRPSFIQSELVFFYILGFLTVLCIWIIKNILHGRIGRSFIAIKDSEVAAQSIGVNISFYKTIMFSISAFFTGIAGGMNGYWVGFVSPDDFSIVTSCLLLAMIVVGGLGSIPGAVLGAVLFSILPHFSDAYIGITNIVIGVAVVLVMMFRPNGLVSLFQYKKERDVQTVVKEVDEGVV